MYIHEYSFARGYDTAEVINRHYMILTKYKDITSINLAIRNVSTRRKKNDFFFPSSNGTPSALRGGFKRAVKTTSLCV